MDRMLYMGMMGSLLIAGIICFRHFFARQVPKRFLVVLWICAIVRLLVPVFIPVRMSVNTGCKMVVLSDREPQESILYGRSAARQRRSIVYEEKKPTGITEEIIRLLKRVFFMIWQMGAVLLTARIFGNHIRSLGTYRQSLPADQERADTWRQTHHSLRRVEIRQSEFIRSPLTYGIFRPVILLPSKIQLSEEEFLCVMEHEWIHIYRWDVLVKYLSYLALCIYWFDPLVWCMVRLLNRDMEQACDEEAVGRHSDRFKKIYALILIRLAKEQSESVHPVNVCFVRHSQMEERIWMIMNKKKYSARAVVLAIGMLCCTFTTFTVSAQEASEKADIEKDAGETPKENTEGFTEKVISEDKGWQKQADNPEKPSANNHIIAGKARQAVSGEQVAELAGTYLGAPYKTGGSDLSSGVDSYGFVRAIYELTGIELPSGLHELAVDKKEVSLSELCAGDIIIYPSAYEDYELAYAAIYAGNGQVIRASNMREGVKVSDLNYREAGMAVRILE